MPDRIKVSQLNSITSLDAVDYLYSVDVSAGTSGSRKITIPSVSKSIGNLASTVTDIIGNDTANINDSSSGIVKKINLDNFWISIKKNAGDLPSGWNRIDPSYYTSVPVFEYYNGSSFVIPPNWEANHTYSLHSVVKEPSISTYSYMYECVSSTGVTGASKPIFPLTEGTDVVDNSNVVWCARGYTVIETTIDFSAYLHIYAGCPMIIEYTDGSGNISRMPRMLKLVNPTRISVSGEPLTNLTSGGAYTITDMWIGNPNICEQFNFNFSGNWNSDASDIDLLDKYGRPFRWNLPSSYVVEYSVKTKTNDGGFNNFINILANGVSICVNRNSTGIQPDSTGEWSEVPYSSFSPGHSIILKEDPIQVYKYDNVSCTRTAADLSVSFTTIPIYGFSY